MPKQPDLIAQASQADPHVSEAAKQAASADYAASTSEDEDVKTHALAQLRELSALSGQNGGQIVVASGAAPTRAGLRSLARKLTSN